MVRTIPYTFEEVEKVFNDADYKLLSTEYINCKTKLQYMCPNGHIREMNFDSFKNGKSRCPVCQQTEKYTIEYVKQCFSSIKGLFFRELSVMHSLLISILSLLIILT